MDSRIEQLVQLQALEVERTQLEKELRALPAQIDQATKELAAAESRRNQLTRSLTDEEALRARMEKEIADHRQKATRYRTQLDSVTTSAQAEAMEKEIHFADSEAERLENEEFASLERSESHQDELGKALEVVTLKETALSKTRLRVAERQQEFNTRLATLKAERETLRPQMDEELLHRFERLCTTRGTGLAKAENQLCMGCRMSIRLQVWGHLREGELLTCDSCGRLLYWDPDMRALVS